MLRGGLQLEVLGLKVLGQEEGEEEGGQHDGLEGGDWPRNDSTASGYVCPSSAVQ